MSPATTRPPSSDPVSAPDLPRVRWPFRRGTRPPLEACAGIDWEALTPRSTYARRIRPVLDGLLLVAVSPLALPLLGLITLVNAVAFRGLSQAFFLQPRVGRRGRIFTLIKFRTMSGGRARGFDSWDTDDHLRVTRLGRILRNTHLDELPQLINVLRGNMSFIGPRPEMVEIESWAGEEIPEFSRRLAIKPGITGLAQVTQGYTGRDVEAYTEKLRINDEYRSRMSFAFDVRLVLMTLVWMIRGKGWKWKQPDSTAARQPASSDSQREAA